MWGAGFSCKCNIPSNSPGLRLRKPTTRSQQIVHSLLKKRMGSIILLKTLFPCTVAQNSVELLVYPIGVCIVYSSIRCVWFANVILSLRAGFDLKKSWTNSTVSFKHVCICILIAKKYEHHARPQYVLPVAVHVYLRHDAGIFHIYYLFTVGRINFSR